MKFKKKFNIGKKVVGDKNCLIVAEAGVNHFGSLNKAKKLVDISVSAGADIFKIQHFYNDKLFQKDAIYWKKRMKKKQLSEEKILEIKKYCSQKKILFMCTAHDEKSLEFLHKKINTIAYKIGSGEIGNYEFIKKIAMKKKPIILSTGMYTMRQIISTVNLISRFNNKLCILHCTTSYPTKPKNINLNFFKYLKKKFKIPIGYSDHTVGYSIPLAAAALGACVIEKHISLDFNIKNAQDWKVSLNAKELKNFVQEVKTINLSMGNGIKNKLSKDEQKSKKWAQKSIVLRKNFKKGEIIKKEYLEARRPNNSIPIEDLAKIIGKKIKKNVYKGEYLKLRDLT